MKLKKITALMLALVLVLGAFAGCSGNKDASPSPDTESTAPESSAPESETPESSEPEDSAGFDAELSQTYADAITSSRSDEDNEYNGVVSSPDDESAQMLLDVLGLSADDMDAFAVSVSVMNVKAYGIAVVKPAEGKEDTVKNSLQNFIDGQKQSFEHYLVDQYEVASSAKLEVLDDGTVVLVMCEDSDTVFDNIVKALEA